MRSLVRLELNYGAISPLLLSPRTPRRVCTLVPKAHTREVVDRQCTTSSKQVCTPVPKQVSNTPDILAILRQP